MGQPKDAFENRAKYRETSREVPNRILETSAGILHQHMPSHVGIVVDEGELKSLLPEYSRVRPPYVVGQLMLLAQVEAHF